MVSTNEYRKAFGTSGAARKQLQASWGAWADEFCDGLLLRLIQPTTDCKIHLWKQRASADGEFQVNIDAGVFNSYTNDVTDDPLKVIGERLSGSSVVRDTDSV